MNLVRPCVLVAAMLLVCQSSSDAQEMPASWLRAVETTSGSGADRRAESVRLEVAVRRYQAPGQPGGEIALVGVTHIGDAAYYEALAALLAEYDTVLFESIAPAGANGVDGADDSERARNTREAMRFIGRLLERHFARTSELPPSLEALASATGELDSRLPAWVEAASRDGWSAPLVLEIIPPEAAGEDGHPARVGWRLVSHGSDRAPSGAGWAEDIVLVHEEIPASPAPTAGMQAEIADVLGLSFQLHALDYGGEGWVLADMTEPELRAAARQRDVDPGPLMDGLAGAGLPARLGRTILILLRVADFFSGNQVRDLIKVVMVEILADPRSLELARQDGGPLGDMRGLMEVILLDRNTVALAKLDDVLEDGPAGRVALFYGAAHMPGLAEGLHERGYREHGEVAWVPAIEVDLEASNVDPQTLELVRRRIHGSLGSRDRRDGSIEDGDDP